MWLQLCSVAVSGRILFTRYDFFLICTIFVAVSEPIGLKFGHNTWNGSEEIITTIITHQTRNAKYIWDALIFYFLPTVRSMFTNIDLKVIFHGNIVIKVMALA